MEWKWLNLSLNNLANLCLLNISKRSLDTELKQKFQLEKCLVLLKIIKKNLIFLNILLNNLQLNKYLICLQKESWGQILKKEILMKWCR